jgi:hypothetical protein
MEITTMIIELGNILVETKKTSGGPDALTQPKFG